MAYRYRENYSSNKVDIPYFSSPDCRQHVAIIAIGVVNNGSFAKRDERIAICVTAQAGQSCR